MNKKNKYNFIVPIFISLIVIGVISLIFVDIYEDKKTKEDNKEIEVEEKYEVDDEYSTKYVQFSNIRHSIGGSVDGFVSFLKPYEPIDDLSDSNLVLMTFKTKTGKIAHLYAKSNFDSNITYKMSKEEIQEVTFEDRSLFNILKLPVNENTQWSTSFQPITVAGINMEMEKASGIIENYKYVIYDVTNRFRTLGVNIGVEFVVMSDELSEKELDEITQEIIKTIR